MNFSKTWLTVLAAFGGGLIGSMLMQAPAPVEAQDKADSVVASEFVLRGKDGNTRARLHVDSESNATQLVLFDGSGNELLRLHAGSGNSAKMEYARLDCMSIDKKVEARFGVSQQFPEKGDMDANDADIKPVAGVALYNEYAANSFNRLTLDAGFRRCVIKAESTKGESSDFDLRLGKDGNTLSLKQNGKTRVALGTDSSGASSIQLKDSKEATTWSQSSR